MHQLWTEKPWPHTPIWQFRMENTLLMLSLSNSLFSKYQRKKIDFLKKKQKEIQANGQFNQNQWLDFFFVQIYPNENNRSFNTYVSCFVKKKKVNKKTFFVVFFTNFWLSDFARHLNLVNRISMLIWIGIVVLYKVFTLPTPNKAHTIIIYALFWTMYLHNDKVGS